MVLHAEQRHRFVAKPFQRIVVQIDVGQFDVVGVDGIWVYGEVVIVCGDLYLTGRIITYRVIPAMVSEFQLVSFATESETAQLVAETDAEDRNAADHVADSFCGIVDGFRIAGAVGEKDAVGIQCHYIGGGCLRGHHCHIAGFACQHAQDVLLDAEIVCDTCSGGFSSHPGNSGSPVWLRLSSALKP